MEPAACCVAMATYRPREAGEKANPGKRDKLAMVGQAAAGGRSESFSELAGKRRRQGDRHYGKSWLFSHHAPLRFAHVPSWIEA